MNRRSGPQHSLTEARSYELSGEIQRDSGPNSTYLGHKGLDSTCACASRRLGSRPGACVARDPRGAAGVVRRLRFSCIIRVITRHALVTYVSCHTDLRLARRSRVACNDAQRCTARMGGTCRRPRRRQGTARRRAASTARPLTWRAALSRREVERQTQRRHRRETQSHGSKRPVRDLSCVRQGRALGSARTWYG